MHANNPQTWDIETDFISIGSGIGGLAAAISAHDNGGKALVLERSDMAGGVTALSMGEVWIAGNHLAAAAGIKDSVDSGFKYLQRLSMGYGNEQAILNLVLHAPEAFQYFEKHIGLKLDLIHDCPDYYYGHTDNSVAAGRLLEPAPFPATTLGDWQQRTRVSPQMPYGMTHADISEGGGSANIARWDFEVMGNRLANDERCLGPGLAAYFVKGALDRDIPIYLNTAAEELISDGERVIGVRAKQDDRDIFIKANRGVLIAASSYERNSDYNKTLGQQLDIGSMLFSAIDGSHLRLAGPLGARTAKVPDITILGYIIPGEEDTEGGQLWRSGLLTTGLPHTVVVNSQAKRFGNEAFYRDICYRVDDIDGSTQTHPNIPCWVIFDSQAKAKYPIGSIMPDQDWPSNYGVRADTLAGLAEQLGIDAAQLESTISRFNQHAEQGEDPDFGRGSHAWSAWLSGDPNQKPNPNLGTVSQAPFYAMELRRMGGSAIPSAGLLTDHHCRIVNWHDQPIPGLYAAGNSTARMETGAMMQSGISNARGMTQGWLAGRHAMGNGSELLEKAVTG